MNNIIMGLLYIEEEASQISERAEKEKTELDRRIEDARLEIEKRVNDRTEKRIQKARHRIQSEADEKINAINVRAKKQTVDLERQYDENHKKWEDEIYDLVLK